MFDVRISAQRIARVYSLYMLMRNPLACSRSLVETRDGQKQFRNATKRNKIIFSISERGAQSYTPQTASAAGAAYIYIVGGWLMAAGRSVSSRRHLQATLVGSECGLACVSLGTRFLIHGVDGTFRWL